MQADSESVLVGLLPDSPVDAFTQQVCVTAVPRILLDPVHQDLSYGDAVLADAFTEVHMTGERGFGFGLLARQSGPSGIDHVLVGDRAGPAVRAWIAA